MDTSNDNIRKLFDMLDNPAAYSEQEIHDLVNCDDETREAYRLMVEAKRSSRWNQPGQSADVDAAWQRFEQKHYSKRRLSHRWMRIAAVFIAAAFIAGLSFAAYHALSSRQDDDSQRFTDEKMLRLTENGEKVIISWLKGTWIEKDDGSYIEDSPIVHSPGLRPDYATIKIDGKEIDVNDLPDLPASAVRKAEVHLSQGRTVNLITMPVQIPADLNGNINPELTILLTGTVPKGAYQPVTIWQSDGIKDSYDWHDYTYTSWTGQWENVRNHLKRVVNRKDHHVRINVCKDVPQKHIDRITKIMRECNVTNYELVKQ